MPFEIRRPIPSKSVDVPSVAIIAGAPTYETNIPFIAPAAQEDTIATSIASAIVTVGSAPLLYIVLITVAASMLPMVPDVITERFIPPVSMVTVMARANSPNSGS